MTKPDRPLVLALPKGRILEEVMPLVRKAGIEPEADFDNKKSRKLMFDTNHADLKIIRVRAFDAATFAAFGGADLAVVGNDVLLEFDYDGLYAPLDLNIGHCRLSLAAPEGDDLDDLARMSHIRIATKYPHITGQYFANLGIQAECVKLNGAMEIAPSLGLSKYIVDLVSTGGTLRANKLTEVRQIIDITSRLVVNRTAAKTRSEEINGWVNAFEKALDHV